MKLTLSIKMDNAAFEPDWAAEAAQILRNASEYVNIGIKESPLLDSNGNVVGTFKVTGKPSNGA